MNVSLATPDDDDIQDQVDEALKDVPHYLMLDGVPEQLKHKPEYADWMKIEDVRAMLAKLFVQFDQRIEASMSDIHD